MLTTAVFLLVQQQFYHATEIGNVATAVSAFAIALFCSATFKL